MTERAAYSLRMLGKILFVIVLQISGTCQSMVNRSVATIVKKLVMDQVFKEV